MQSTSVPRIVLSPNEEQFLSLIDQFSKHIQATDGIPDKVECRVAGGWVRDKLLGLPCHDIDISISSLTGYHFATLLEQYVASQPSTSSLPKVRITKIVANPDQSKHLETATTTMFGLDVDFVQLRSEEYASDTGRIPTEIRFGTPLEDALRRDITINTLFYNVHSRQVEDWTEKGITDLLSSKPLIRTPLPPKQTFLDDPLRILRCIRFASRFQIPLDADIVTAVADPEVREALSSKVSKERIGIELEKMLKDKTPLLALQHVRNIGVYDLIFQIPTTIQSSEPVPTTAADEAVKAGEIAQWLVNQDLRTDIKASQHLLSVLADETERKRFWLAVALTPLRHITFIEKKKTFSVIEYIIRDSIKFPNSDRTFVGHIHKASSIISQPRLASYQTPSERVAIGLLLRNADVHDASHGPNWRSSLLYAMLLDIMPHWPSNTAKMNEIIHLYDVLLQKILELGLDEAAFHKPCVDGTEILALLELKPGRHTATLLHHVLCWQLDHPQGSKEECKAWLKESWSQGLIKVEEEQAKAPRQKKRKS